MNAEILLGLEFLVFATGMAYIAQRDKVIATYFLFLFIYAIPAQLGYFYVPEASMLILAYFGEAPWWTATTHIILSLASFALFYAYGRRLIYRAIPVRVELRNARHRTFTAKICAAGLWLLWLGQMAYFALNAENISWATAQDEDFTDANPGYRLFLMSFKLSVGIALVLYTQYRLRHSLLTRHHQLALAVAFVASLVLMAIKLGNRTDLLAFSLGATLFELSRVKITWKIFLKLTLAATLIVAALSLVESLRYEDGAPESDLLTALLVKDYYAPAHMLFAAVSHDFIEPLEVLRSNLANALVMLNVPYLQSTTTELFRPDIATRSAGYAFYIFTEGYIFMGPIGFLYNGIIPLIGLLAWKKLLRTNDPFFNTAMVALMASMLVNLLRGQSSYFIKYFYTWVLPMMLLYCALVGTRLRIRLGSTGKQRTTAGDPEKLPSSDKAGVRLLASRAS